MPQLVEDFNYAASKIRQDGKFMGVQQVQFGKKGSGVAAKIVDANGYNLDIGGKTYYYWETTDGKFISSGLKK